MASIGPIAHDSARHTNNWLILLSRILLPLGLFAIALFGAGVNAAHAGNGKVAADLRAALQHPGANAKWTADTARGKYVQVVISADSRDPSLTDLRGAVLAAGGSVFYAYQSAPALLAVLPAAAVDTHRRPRRRGVRRPQPPCFPDRKLPARHHGRRRRARVQPDVVQRCRNWHRLPRLRHRLVPCRIRWQHQRRRQVQERCSVRRQCRLHSSLLCASGQCDGLDAFDRSVGGLCPRQRDLSRVRKSDRRLGHAQSGRLRTRYARGVGGRGAIDCRRAAMPRASSPARRSTTSACWTRTASGRSATCSPASIG